MWSNPSQPRLTLTLACPHWTVYKACCFNEMDRGSLLCLNISMQITRKKVQYGLAKTLVVSSFCQMTTAMTMAPTVCRANTMVQSLTWWRRLGASHEATKMLHQAMCFALYRTRGMVVATVVDCIPFDSFRCYSVF